MELKGIQLIVFRLPRKIWRRIKDKINTTKEPAAVISLLKPATELTMSIFMSACYFALNAHVD